MANENRLLSVMKSRRKVWTHLELCDQLGVHICELARLVSAAKESGARIKGESGERLSGTSKLWLEQ
ncbi:hypothetical protein ERJ77_01690 [Vibrio anguillarum]|uniref:DNA-binding protein n=2 Tax=Vibrio anguillarum TaxID=55601 RepID=A0AAW4B6E6_VIBAN|nr:hypothetical protein [Vibrio anguillarum]